LPTEVEAYSSLRDYWVILSKRRWQVLTVLLVVWTLVTIYSFKMKPVYRATGRVEIEAETPQIQSLNDLYKNLPADESFLQTQAKVLQSDSLAWQAIQQLGLGTNPEFAPHAGSAQRAAPDPRVLRDLVIKEFSRRLLGL